MSIVTVLIVCLVVGAALYLLGLAPIDGTVKQIIRVVVILLLVIYVIVFIASIFGLSTGLPPMRIR